jgi:phage-related protein
MDLLDSILRRHDILLYFPVKITTSIMNTIPASIGYLTLNFISNWSIKNKLLIPIIVILFGGSVAVYSAISYFTENIQNHVLPQIAQINELRANVLDLSGEYREYINESKPEVLEEIDSAKKSIDAIALWFNSH